MTSIQESIPSWSPDALAARDIFFNQFNSVNFYVEDEDQENLYFSILRRLLPEIQITQIFPLGGKTRVIAHAEDAANQLNAHRSIYIVDKDFDDLLGHVVERENIFYLPKYCIENFFLEEEAIVEVAVEIQPKKTREYIAQRLAYPTFLNNSIEKLDLLFRLFFVVQRLNLGLKNCDLPPEKFSAKRHQENIDEELIKEYQASVKEGAMRTGLIVTENEFDNLVSKAFSEESAPDANISGKFLIALTMHYIKTKLRCGNLSLDSLTYRLARHSSLKDLVPLKARINAYLDKNAKQTHY